MESNKELYSGRLLSCPQVLDLGGSGKHSSLYDKTPITTIIYYCIAESPYLGTKAFKTQFVLISSNKLEGLLEC
jgi:hypothetical protein